MENPALGGAPCQLGGDVSEHTAPPNNVQRVLDLALRHEWPAEALGAALALRLDPPRVWLLAIGGLMALPAEDRETLAETALADLRAGPPVPPFTTLRDVARTWAALACRCELRAYLGACWGRLPETDRASFLREMKRRAAA